MFRQDHPILYFSSEIELALYSMSVQRSSRIVMKCKGSSDEEGSAHRTNNGSSQDNQWKMGVIAHCCVAILLSWRIIRCLHASESGRVFEEGDVEVKLRVNAEGELD
jgi:hypothetical protein